MSEVKPLTIRQMNGNTQSQNIIDLYKNNERVELSQIDPLSRDELLQLQQLVLADLSRMKIQIQEAQAAAAATGDYNDSNWYRRIQGAVHVRRLMNQRIALMLGKRREEQKAHNREEHDRNMVTFLLRAIEEVLPDEWRNQVLEHYHLLRRASL